jgi:type II secretory pathway pseudopilin PulG
VSITNNKYRGFLLTETIVAMSLLGLLLAGLALSLFGLAKFNRYQLVRQRCIAAAQAQIDSIATTGRPISDEDISRLWPGLSVSVKKMPGTGQWKGMERLVVTAGDRVFHKNVMIQLSRYVQANQSSTEGM